MKLTLTIAATLALAIPGCDTGSDACTSSAIKKAGRVTQEQCACYLKGADKYLSKSDKAYLIDYFSGKRSDSPSIFLSKAYPAGTNKPLIKYSAYTSKLCQ